MFHFHSSFQWHKASRAPRPPPRPMLRNVEGSASQVGEGKEPAWQCRTAKGLKFRPWVGKMSWRRPWQSTPVPCLENPRGFSRGTWQGPESQRIRQDRATTHAHTAGWGGAHRIWWARCKWAVRGVSSSCTAAVSPPVLVVECKNAPQPDSITQPGMSPVYRHWCLQSIKERTSWPQCQWLLFFIFRFLFNLFGCIG